MDIFFNIAVLAFIVAIAAGLFYASNYTLVTQNEKLELFIDHLIIWCILVFVITGTIEVLEVVTSFIIH